MSSADSPDLFEPDNWDDLRAPAIALNTGTTNPPTLGLFKDNTTGLVGKSLDFNGIDDWASIASDANYTTGVGASLTFAFWIKPDVAQPDVTVPLCEKDTKWALELRKIGASTYIRLYVGGTPVATSSVALAMGQRNFIMYQLTDSAGTTCCYKLKINNVLAIDYTDGVIDANAAIRWGRGVNLPDYYAGGFDQLVAYDGAALDNATISDGLWNDGKGTATPPTDGGISVISHWKCNEVVSNAVPDENTVQSLVLGDGAGAEAPDLVDDGLLATAVTKGVYTLFFGPGETQEALLAFQLPHGYKFGSDLHPHVHWAPTDNNSGNVVWGLEYCFQSINQVFGATVTSEVTDAADGALKHQLVSFADIPAIGSSNDTSSMIMCRVYRKGDDAADTYPSPVALLEVDIHYQANRAGTQAEYGPY